MRNYHVFHLSFDCFVPRFQHLKVMMDSVCSRAMPSPTTVICSWIWEWEGLEVGGVGEDEGKLVCVDKERTSWGLDWWWCDPKVLTFVFCLCSEQ